VSDKLSLPFRQIHLDFHTGPWIGDVGTEFDPREFARVMKRAHVNSVTVFAKCHHGHLYYNTRRPERHPGLKPGLDLLGEQVEALHREGIRAPIYVSVQCDEYAADHHPEWIARQPDGKPVGAGPLEPGWQIMDMASPYQEYVAEQSREILKLFKPVDGIFYDMCWDQPSLNNHFVDAMIRARLNPESELDRQTYAHRLAHEYMARFNEMIKASSPNATIYWNCRKYSNLREEAKFQTQIEIESLPTGFWGYQYFPRHVRNAYNYPQPYLGMTARFHKSWADFGGLKPPAALNYETSQMIAHGARCSIGDQLHPRGTLDPAAYELIGNAYARIEAREPWIVDSMPVSQIGVFQNRPATADAADKLAESADEGATRMLAQLKHQFRFIDADARLDSYDLLILPDYVRVDRTLATRLKAHVKKGGAILATGNSGLNADASKLDLDILPIRLAGASPFTTSYVRFGKQVSRNVPPTDHVMYEKSVRVTPVASATSLATVVEPYFERGWKHFSSHFQTPPEKPSKYSAAVLKGRIAYIAYPIFSAFGKHANVPCRLLVQNVISMLLDQPLLKVDAPTSLEATVMQQRKRTIVHLLSYIPERRTQSLDLVEDVIPLHDVKISLRMAKAPKSVYLAPEKQILVHQHKAGRVELTVPKIEGHAMVVFE
jgi:hypothetical protein